VTAERGLTADQLDPGDLIQFGLATDALVVEVRRPHHGLADAYGFTAVVVDVICQGNVLTRTTMTKPPTHRFTRYQKGTP